MFLLMTAIAGILSGRLFKPHSGALSGTQESIGSWPPRWLTDEGQLPESL
jgi:hypothetical protein